MYYFQYEEVILMGVGDVTANISKCSGKALYFDGVNDNVTITSNEQLSGNNEQTWTFRIKPVDVAKGRAGIISKYITTVGEREYAIRQGGLDGEIEILISDDGSTFDQSDTTTTPLANNTWKHITITYNRGEIKLFVNGLFTEQLINAKKTIFSSPSDLTYAEYQTTFNKCTLDNLSIFSRILTDKEIKDSSNGKIITRNILTRQSFNNTSDPAHDDSNNGNDGTVTGAVSVGGHDTIEDDITTARTGANDKYNFIPLAGNQIMMAHIEEA